MAVKPPRRRPLVGITAVPRQVPTGYGGDLADTVAAGLVAGVSAAAGVPVVLPVVDARAAAEQVRHLDAVVLSGGQDLDLPHERPRTAGEPWIHPARDRHEFAVWAAARASGIPVLGVCRGLQLVNVALGGSLDAHVDGHDAGVGDPSRGHGVSIAPGSALAAAVGAAEAEVNTIHHQVIRTIARGLTACAWSADGLVEAAEAVDAADGLPWFVGVQWHPELMLDRPAGQALFDALVRAASPEV